MDDTCAGCDLPAEFCQCPTCRDCGRPNGGCVCLIRPLWKVLEDILADDDAEPPTDAGAGPADRPAP